MRKRASLAKFGLGALVLVLAVLVPELALRIAGWKREPGIQFGFPRPSGFAAFETDPELFWKLAPRERASGFQTPGNSLGFPGDEVATPKPAGTFRLLFLGDSCTYFGFPRRVEALLDERDPALGAEAVVLAIPGYTSHQGRVVAERHGVHLEGDLAFVFYGWNDHWRAYGAVDSRRAQHAGAGGGFARLVDASRLVQAARALVGRGAEPLDEPRVPPDEYRANLREIVGLFRARGVEVALITAPTSFDRLGVPPGLVELGFARDGETALELHRRYVAITREVAAETGAALIDLAAEAEAREDVGELFGADGIHFSEAGERWVAERVAQHVAAAARR